MVNDGFYMVNGDGFFIWLMMGFIWLMMMFFFFNMVNDGFLYG